jgi:hypothetical protein
MHPITDLMHPALGKPCWLVQKGHGSFVTMEFGEPRVEMRGPRPTPVRIPGAPARSPRRLVFIRGEWHLWIYCCEWSLTLDGTELAHNEYDNITMNRALKVLNGQILTTAEIEPDSRTRFSFDLGCSFVTCPAPAGTYSREPTTQWYWYSKPGSVIAVRGDGTYALCPPREKLDDQRWLPITGPVHIAPAT